MSTPATQPIITPSTAPSEPTVRVGTRKSALAMKQAEFVVASLQRLHPSVRFEIRGMQSLGDIDKVTALYKMGGKGLWTNELEAGLVAGELDIVVHSLKDMPTVLPDACVLACVTPREDPRDVVVVKRSLRDKHQTLADLPAGAVVGTSSVRRMAQIRRRYPDLAFKDMRGNIDTRLRKLDADDGEYSVLILAAAGLLRMGQAARISQYLESRTDGGGMLHAVGQGGLGIEARAGDEATLALLRPLEDPKAMLACEAERSVMRTLEGGCSIPIGVETAWVGADGAEDAASGQLRLTATVVSVDGARAVDGEDVAAVGSREQAVEFGIRLAKTLADSGAQAILDEINAEREANPNPNPWVPA